VDATDLRRSTLERKDRDELRTIAAALGATPGARAKKGDIVDMILAAAGVPAGAAESGSAESAPAAQPTLDLTPAPAPAAAPEPAPVPEPAAAVDTSAPEPDAPARDEREEPETREERTGNGNGNGGRAEARWTPPAERGDVDDDPEWARDLRGETGEGTEPGNRRRRRRGRDRDREGAPTGQGQSPVPGQPQGGDDQRHFDGEPVEVAGILDLREDGYGFLRINGALPSKADAYVSVKQVRQFGLRKGDHLVGASRPAGRNEKNPALLRIDQVNGRDPEHARNRPRFEELTPLFPDERLRLEVPGDPFNMTTRIIDLLAPIGKGQRGLIVSPPKAGKTTIMKQIARAIETNNPAVHLVVRLVDERPEEVTDMRRWLQRGEVVASTFDRPADEHTQVAELAIERAKRLVEYGEDVCIILDGITRLARAYNLSAPPTGRVMSGGVDSGALYPPKKFFGAARNVEEGGSLTILATALVETGSKMDEVIFEEFKGTGNMELRLDRRIAERRIFPAIDVDGSSTRHEELLFERRQVQQVHKLRRVLHGLATDGDHSGAAGLELLIDRLKSFRTNDEFLTEIAKGPVG
jgi:transcription termination factor Rho